VSGDAAPADRPAPSIEVRRGTPTVDELAALMAVVSEAYADEASSATAPEETRPSAWARSARGLRGPLDRGAGWAGFAG